MFRIFKIFLLLVYSTQSWAAGGQFGPEKESCKNTLGTDLVFPKNNKFLIYEYLPDSDLFVLLNPEAPGEDLTYVTLAGLSVGVQKIQKQTDLFIKNPINFVGEIFTGENDVPGLTIPEVQKRKHTCSRKLKK